MSITLPAFRSLTAAQVGVSLVMAAGCALAFEGGLGLSGATPQVWAIIFMYVELVTLQTSRLTNMLKKSPFAATLPVQEPYATPSRPPFTSGSPKSPDCARACSVALSAIIDTGLIVRITFRVYSGGRSK